MNYILLFTTLIFFIALAYSYFSLYNQRKTTENRIEVLERIIIMLQEKQLAQQKKLQLSDALNTQLRNANNILRTSIVDLNTDLIENLFNKKS